jgi:hypothetical protein
LKFELIWQSWQKRKPSGTESKSTGGGANLKAAPLEQYGIVKQEKRKMNNDMESGYELEFDGEKYFVDSNGDGAVIMDVEGDFVMSLGNMNYWTSNEPMPVVLAKFALLTYGKGREDGVKFGYLSCQFDMKKVLGL